MTPLYTAIFNGHRRVVELLLAAGGNPNIQKKVRTTDAVRRILECIVISHSLKEEDVNCSVCNSFAVT